MDLDNEKGDRIFEQEKEVGIKGSICFFLIHSIAESSIYFIGGAEQLLFIFSIAVLYAVTVAKRKSVNE